MDTLDFADVAGCFLVFGKSAPGSSCPSAGARGAGRDDSRACADAASSAARRKTDVPKTPHRSAASAPASRRSRRATGDKRPSG